MICFTLYSVRLLFHGSQRNNFKFKIAEISVSSGFLLLRNLQPLIFDGGDDLQRKKSKETAHIFNK
jgi:hypothetical protein